MRRLSKSTAISVTLGYGKSSQQLVQEVTGDLMQRIAEATTAENIFDDIADMGRWSRDRTREVVRAYRPPKGIVVRDVILTFFSEEGGRGKMLMKISCRRDGKMEVF